MRLREHPPPGRLVEDRHRAGLQIGVDRLLQVEREPVVSEDVRIPVARIRRARNERPVAEMEEPDLVRRGSPLFAPIVVMSIVPSVASAALTAASMSRTLRAGPRAIRATARGSRCAPQPQALRSGHSATSSSYPPLWPDSSSPCRRVGDSRPEGAAPPRALPGARRTAPRRGTPSRRSGRRP